MESAPFQALSSVMERSWISRMKNGNVHRNTCVSLPFFILEKLKESGCQPWKQPNNIANCNSWSPVV